MYTFDFYYSFQNRSHKHFASVKTNVPGSCATFFQPNSDLMLGDNIRDNQLPANEEKNYGLYGSKHNVVLSIFSLIIFFSTERR